MGEVSGNGYCVCLLCWVVCVWWISGLGMRGWCVCEISLQVSVSGLCTSVFCIQSA